VKAIVDFRDPSSASAVAGDTCLIFLTAGRNARFRHVSVDDFVGWLDTGLATEHEIHSGELADQEWEFGDGPGEPRPIERDAGRGPTPANPPEQQPDV
jgi:hypothetical protein